MPAHIGMADHVRLGLRFVLANTSQSRDARHAREMGGAVSMKHLKENLEQKRERREHHCQSYLEFRNWLNTFGPDIVVPRGQVNRRSCERVEWDLYLKPDTAFDLTCRQYFKLFRGMEMVVIGHKSNAAKLKRIEAHPPGERMRILWSEA